MRINIALFDKDKNYSTRLLKSFQDKYVKEISISVFSDENLFVSELSSQHFDMVVIDQEYIHLRNHVPDRAVLAVLTKDNYIEEFEQIPAIGKYQKVETLYKRFIGIFADNSVGIKVRGSGAKANIILFTSAQGGSGTSSLAAAYAVNQAEKGKSVFFLNLETFGSSNSYFQGEGQGSFSDIIYALKSNNINLTMKLMSTIKRDASGVEFIDECRNAYDMLELKDQEIDALIEAISSVKEYDVVIIDYSGVSSERQMFLMKTYADSIVYVNDGSEIGNTKFTRFCEVIAVVEKMENKALLSKMALVYNRFSSQTGRQLQTIPIARLGGIHRIEGITGRELVEELSRQEVMADI